MGHVVKLSASFSDFQFFGIFWSPNKRNNMDLLPYSAVRLPGAHLFAGDCWLIPYIMLMTIQFWWLYGMFCMFRTSELANPYKSTKFGHQSTKKTCQRGRWKFGFHQNQSMLRVCLYFLVLERVNHPKFW